MTERSTSELLDTVRALRSEMEHMAEELAGLRQDVLELKSAVTSPSDSDPATAIRRLWAEGLASGIAGELDEVFDGVVAGLPKLTAAS
jgi:hypothetical protein